MAIDTSWVWTGGGLAVLGIIALVVSMFLGKQSGAPRGLKTLFVVGGVTLLLLGVALTFGIGGLTSTPQTTAGTARYEVTVTAGDSQNVSNIAIDDTARTIQVRIQCSSTCSTFDYSSGTAELNFTVGRADTGTQDSIFDAKVVSVGLVSDSSGDGTTHPIVAQYSDSRYKTEWEKGPNAAPISVNKETTVLLEGGGASFVRLNVTWSIGAAFEQSAFDTATVTVSVAGETWTITEILTARA